MTQTGVKIENFVIGDAFRVQRTYTGLQEGIIIEKAWLTVKDAESDLDATALFQKVITASLTAAGQITDADTTGGSIAMFFDIVKADNQGAKPYRSYYYDVQVKRNGESKVHTMEKGFMNFIKGITDADT